jgi:natural product precursor
MNKMSLANMQGKLSQEEMRNIKGGYSVLYCTWHSFNIVINGTVIKQGRDYDECRRAQD